MINEEKAIKAYINTPKTVEFYKKAFEKYNISGIDQFRWHWSGWAFAGGMFYLLYRKLYLEAVVYFFVFILLMPLPLVNLIAWIASGGILPYFVYKRYKKIKTEVENNLDNPHQQIDVLRELGGVNKWGIWLAVMLNIAFIGALMYITLVVSTNDFHMNQ